MPDTDQPQNNTNMPQADPANNAQVPPSAQAADQTPPAPMPQANAPQPQEQASAEAPAEAPAKPAAGGQARGIVLIADDDITLRDMYQTRLETDGFQVLVAADGEEALNMIKQKKPDMVLLDIMMPKMNGLDVLAEMKKDAELKAIPVIILTALIQDLTKVKSLLTGADDYLMKSEVMPGEVIKKVENTLEKSK